MSVADLTMTELAARNGFLTPQERDYTAREVTRLVRESMDAASAGLDHLAQYFMHRALRERAKLGPLFVYEEAANG